jgi:putative alpha-1,2-mannosidase
LRLSILLCLLLFLPLEGYAQSDLTKYVDPFVGTGGHGHTYPGATLPFGMVQLSPDTRLTGWDGCSGYHYSDRPIYGFSHTHLSGTGISDYGDILFMPVLGDGAASPATFKHENESAEPGYYSVKLDDGILAELTVTRRAGYQDHGYIDMEQERESVSRTLEYAYDDWCIAQMAHLTGHTDDFKRYIRRAQSYQNIFDSESGFMRPRSNGGWAHPFDPREVTFSFTEANSWQYTFFVPQDVSGLIELLGGAEKFARKLDEMFAAESKTTGREQADITGLMGQYAHGNEPSHHIAYLYNYANQPWKTQARVRQIMDQFYHPAPDGLIGNEDCGQMSAWYVLSAAGIYPVTPGSGSYAIGSPIFTELRFNLENGKSFAIKARGVSDHNVYIQSATLNGKRYSKSFISHRDLMNGGELTFVMGSTPNVSWSWCRECAGFANR